ncbi:hypothetical protein WYMAN_193 [Vibrio phage Wyman]|nr:hypothetical protein WYMAN_193 [Vibrio phage Wyman]
MKLYIAVEAHVATGIDEMLAGHITLAFMDIAETDKLFFEGVEFSTCDVFVEGVEYWADSDVTVLTVIPDEIEWVREYLEGQGFTYDDHEWIPHITVKKGNHVTDYSHLIDSKVHLGSAYLRLKDFK